MSESKVTLSKLVGQAWGQLQEMVLEEIRRRVEELAEAERESLLGRGRHVRRGGPLRRWGYRVRKVLLTPWGMISGLRLPRIRDVEAKREVAFLSSEGNQARLAEMLLASTLGGMSYRKVVNWARRHLGAVISADWVGRVVAEAAARIEDRRGRSASHTGLSKPWWWMGYGCITAAVRGDASARECCWWRSDWIGEAASGCSTGRWPKPRVRRLMPPSSNDSMNAVWRKSL